MLESTLACVRRLSVLAAPQREFDRDLPLPGSGEHFSAQRGLRIIPRRDVGTIFRDPDATESRRHGFLGRWSRGQRAEDLGLGGCVRLGWFWQTRAADDGYGHDTGSQTSVGWLPGRLACREAGLKELRFGRPLGMARTEVAPALE